MRLIHRFWRWLWGEPEPPLPPDKHYKLPEEYEEDEIVSMDMHFGDEPLYYVDPPTWPFRR